MSQHQPNGKVRYAVVGTGWFGQTAILPAFKNARENSELTALVSSNPEKREKLSRMYDIAAYSREEYESLLASGAIDAVVIVTPNAVHREQTLIAARHGVHVLCEKPLAESPSAAQEMVLACDRAGVKLMTAYRLHFEAAHLATIDAVGRGEIGDPRIIESVFTQQVAEGNTRLNADLGGGPLHDVGIYCINAARYLFRAEPEEVIGFAATRPETRFRQVPEAVSAVLRFPGHRLATFSCGFGQAQVSSLRVVGTTGDIRLEPAFSHRGERALYLTADGQTTETRYKDCDQIGPELIYFSKCILEDRRPEPDGLEGLIDLRIIEAIERSIEKGMAVPLPMLEAPSRPEPEQRIEKPAVREPEMVQAAHPSES